MNHYGISSWIVTHISADKAIEELAATGFKEIELSGTQSGLLKEWEDAPVNTFQKLASVGIDVPSIHCPIAGRRLDDPDDDIRFASINANITYLNKMKNCGIREIVIHPIGSGDYSTPENQAESRRNSLESIRELARYAGSLGVRMAVENLAPNKPGHNVADLLEIIDGLGDHVGICIDIGHASIAGYDLMDELKMALSAGKLFSLHIHDVNESNRDHFIPGEGRIDCDALITELDTWDFKGGRILEISPPEENTVNRLRKAAAVKDKWEKLQKS